MRRYVRTYTRGRLFPRNPLHPTMTTFLARGERGESFLCLTLQEESPLLISSGFLFRCARLGEGSYLAVRVYPGYKTAEERASSVGRESPSVTQRLRARDKREHKREYEKERRGAEEKGGVRGARSVIIAEAAGVATPASLTARSTAK